MSRVPRELTLEREKRAWELRVEQQLTLREIAATLGVTPSAVCRMLKRVEPRVLAALHEQVLAFKVEHATRLETLYNQAMAAFERSKQGPTIIHPDGTPGRLEFLEAAHFWLDELRRIWGVTYGDTPLAARLHLHDADESPPILEFDMIS